MDGAKLRRRPRRSIWLPLIWFVVVSIFLLWQKLTYSGIFAFAAGWQFWAFGAYRPALTYLVLVLILATPLLLLPRSRETRSARASASPQSRADRAIDATTRTANTLVGAAIATALAALVIAVSTLFLPRATGPVSQVVISDDGGPPPLGPVSLKGQILYGKTSVFNEDFVSIRRSNRFAPMVADGVDPTILHYFVELPTDVAVGDVEAQASRQGILRKGGLPGELFWLYRYAGFQVDPNYYVLFSSPESMRRGDLTEALELLVLGLGLGILGVLYAHGRRRLRKIAIRALPAPEAV